MKIVFTYFPQDSNWCNGKLENTNIHFAAKLFDTPSKFGIDQGRVSKLHVTNGEETIISYDRGWDIRPEKQTDFEKLHAILQFLEASPYRFGEVAMV